MQAVWLSVLCSVATSFESHLRATQQLHNYLWPRVFSSSPLKMQSANCSSHSLVLPLQQIIIYRLNFYACQYMEHCAAGFKEVHDFLGCRSHWWSVVRVRQCLWDLMIIGTDVKHKLLSTKLFYELPYITFSQLCNFLSLHLNSKFQ